MRTARRWIAPVAQASMAVRLAFRKVMTVMQFSIPSVFAPSVFATILTMIGSMAGPSGQAFAADAEQGKVLATRWCAACHIVSADQTRGTASAPSFAAIAAGPEFDAGRVALFLLAPHPKMPDMNLTRSEAADLSAYIATLKRK